MLAILAAGAYFVYQQNQNATQSSRSNDTNSVDYGKASDDQTAAGDQIKSDSVKGNNTDTPPSPSTQPGSNKKVAEVSITAKSQTQIRFQINALVENGTCTLTFTKGSTVVTKTANVQNLSNTSTCTGFDIPVSELSSGTWQLKLTVDSPTITGSVNDTITVQ